MPDGSNEDGPHPENRKISYNSVCTLWGGFVLRALEEALANPLQGVQIDQDVGQGVVIGNRKAIA